MVANDKSIIKVGFCVTIGNNICINESQLEHDLDRYREILVDRTNHEGAICIRASGQPEVRIEDELQVAIPYICFASIPPLLGGNRHVFSYFSMDGTVNFDPEDNNVRISGDYIPSILVSRIELLESLYCCGLRFIEYFQTLRGNDWWEIIESLRMEAEAAKRAMSAISSS